MLRKRERTTTQTQLNERVKPSNHLTIKHNPINLMNEVGMEFISIDLGWVIGCPPLLLPFPLIDFTNKEKTNEFISLLMGLCD